MARVPLLTWDRVPQELLPAFDEVTADRGGVINAALDSVMVNSPEMYRRSRAIQGFLREQSSLPVKIQELDS